MSSPIFRSLKRVVSPKVSPRRSPKTVCRKQLLQIQEEPCKSKVFDKCDIKPRKNLFPPLIHVNDFEIPDITNYVKTSSDLDVNKCHILGKGSFCTVILANYEGSYIAAKLVSKTNPQSNNLVSREKNVLNMNHPNIVKVYKILEDLPNYILVLTELCPPTTLQNIIDEKQVNLRRHQKLGFIINICQGLDFCHDKGIIHLDIKPKNILVDLYMNSCKICDFGNSLKLNELPSLSDRKIQGTIKYMAPELLKGDMPSEKSDIFSLGITMWQTVHEEIPYNHLTNETLIYLVITKDYRLTCKESFLSEEYKKCWAKKPEDRPSIKELLNKLIIKKNESFND